MKIDGIHMPEEEDRPPPPEVPDHELFPEPVGEGSYGWVYLARSRATGAWRAVKVVRRSKFDSDRPYEREFRGIRKFEPVSRSHPSQLNILHVGRDDTAGFFYYVLELADPLGGGPIEAGRYHPHTLEADLRTQGRLPVVECLRIGLALATALDHLHRRDLVHRDIKPANIIFVNGLPKLADIGLVTDTAGTMTGVGAEGFIPPEGPGRPPADIYALGKVLYEMATGRDRTEFPGLPDLANVTDRRELVEFSYIWNKACEPDPRDRYATASELHAELAWLQSGKSVHAQRQLEQRLRWTRRISLVAAGLLVLGGVGFWTADRVRAATLAQDRRSVSIREARNLRVTGHEPGWSAQALAKLETAGRLHFDAEVHAEAAACCAGLDARVVKFYPGLGSASLAFDRRGERLLIAGGVEGQPVQLWDGSEGGLRRLRCKTIGPISFGPDDRPLQFAHWHLADFALLDPSEERLARTFRVPTQLLELEGQDSRMVAMPDGSYVAIAVIKGLKRGRTAVWNGRSGELLGIIECEARAIEFVPDGSWLALGDDAGRLRRFALPSLQEASGWECGRGAIEYLAIGRNPYVGDAADARAPEWLVAAASQGGNLTVWDARSARQLSTCRGSRNDVFAVAFSPDGMTMASGGREAVRLWDVFTGTGLLAIRHAEDVAIEYASTLAFTTDGRWLAAGTRADFPTYWSDIGPGGRVRAVNRPPSLARESTSIWELESGRGIRLLRGLSAQISRLTFAPGGHRLAALSDDWKVAVWDLRSHRLEWVFNASPGFAADRAGLAFSQDGNRLAVAAGKGARLWELTTGRREQEWELPWGVQDDLVFDGNGRLMHARVESLSTNEWHGICRVRELGAAGQATPRFETSQFNLEVLDQSFSARGAYLVVAGAEASPKGTNHVARVFELASQREVFAVPLEPGDTTAGVFVDAVGASVAFSPVARGGTSIRRLADGGEVEFVSKPLLAIAGGAEAKAFMLPSSGFLLSVRNLRAGNGPATGRADRSMPPWELPLGTDSRLACRPAFDQSGQFVAWGTEDGVVAVCEITALQRRLAQLGVVKR